MANVRVEEEVARVMSGLRRFICVACCTVHRTWVSRCTHCQAEDQIVERHPCSLREEALELLSSGRSDPTDSYQ